MFYAILHYLVVLLLAGLIFLAIHLPPKAIHIDPLIEVLVGVEDVLLILRKGLLWLWPWEFTPAGLGLVLTVINSLGWGLILVSLVTFWKKITT